MMVHEIKETIRTDRYVRGFLMAFIVSLLWSVMMLSAASIVGHVIDIPVLYKWTATDSGMAISTGVCLFLTALATWVLCVLREVDVMRGVERTPA